MTDGLVCLQQRYQESVCLGCEQSQENQWAKENVISFNVVDQTTVSAAVCSFHLAVKTLTKN